MIGPGLQFLLLIISNVSKVILSFSIVLLSSLELSGTFWGKKHLVLPLWDFFPSHILALHFLGRPPLFSTRHFKEIFCSICLLIVIKKVVSHYCLDFTEAKSMFENANRIFSVSIYVQSTMAIKICSK